MGSARYSTTPGSDRLAVRRSRSASISIGSTRGVGRFGATAAKISKINPPCPPPVIAMMASRLLGSRALIDNQLEDAVALVHRARKRKGCRKSDAFEPDGPEMPFGDANSHDPFTAPVRRQGIELTGTPPRAIATTSLFPFDMPRHCCHVVPPRLSVVDRPNVPNEPRAFASHRAPAPFGC